MGHFSAFVVAYREALSASLSATQGAIGAAANVNHCYASVKLWLLLDVMLSQDPESPDSGAAVSKAGPFVIWNELWPPFSDLISAHEADVQRGQNTVRTRTPRISSDSQLYLKNLATLGRYVVRNRGPLPFSAGDPFSFNVRVRGARGYS